MVDWVLKGVMGAGALIATAGGWMLLTGNVGGGFGLLVMGTGFAGLTYVASRLFASEREGGPDLFEAARLAGGFFMVMGGLGVAGGVGAAIMKHGGIAGVSGAMGLAFVGLGYGARRAFRSPEGKKRVPIHTEQVEAVDEKGPGGTARVTTYEFVGEDAGRAEVARQRERRGERLRSEPWHARDEWHDAEMTLEQKARASHSGRAAAVAAGIGGVFAGIAALATDSVFLIFSGVGVSLVFVGAWLYRRRRAQKFGNTTLVIDGAPGFVRDTFGGWLYINIAKEALPASGVHLTLGCYRRTVRLVNRRGKGPAEERVALRALWEKEQRVHRGEIAETASKVLGEKEAPASSPAVVPFRFALPEEVPSATPRKKKERLLWALDVHIAQPGVDYGARFELPIFWRKDFDA